MSRLVDPYAAGLAAYLAREYSDLVAKIAAADAAIPSSPDAGIPPNMRRCWLTSADENGHRFGKARKGQIHCRESRGMPSCLVVRTSAADEALAADYERLPPIEREILTLWAASAILAKRDRAGWVASHMTLPPERAPRWSADAIRRRLAMVERRIETRSATCSPK